MYLEPARADLDGEHPVASVQALDALLERPLGFPGATQQGERAAISPCPIDLPAGCPVRGRISITRRASWPTSSGCREPFASVLAIMA